MKSKYLALFLLCAAVSAKAQCSPFQGLGAVQFFDNNGVPLTNGVLYSFVAGTSTQAPTFTDSTCTVQNVNPITMTTGARTTIWLNTGSFFKFQLCLQNDGSTCAPSDVLFSVDQVPGGASGGGGGGGPPFVSGSPNPATTGVLRCASGDQCVAFRNAANSANLTITKDSNDVLSWAGGSIKFPAVATPSGLGTGFSWLWDDSSANRWKVSNNGAAGVNLVVSGVDINSSDQVTQLHFGATAAPLCSTAPTLGNALVWNGTQFCPAGGSEFVINGPPNITTISTSLACTTAGGGGSAGDCLYYTFANPHTATRLIVATTVVATGCSTQPVVGIKDMTSSTIILSVNAPGSLGIVTTTGSATIPASDTIGVGLLTAGIGCSSFPQFQSINVIYQ